MKGTPTMNFGTQIFPILLGIVAAVIVFSTLNGKALPLIATPRAALISLLVVGMIACTGGIGQVGASGRWASPLAILGYLLGAAILMVFIGALAGWKLPMIDGEKQALVAMAVLMAVKYVFGISGTLFHWL